MNTRRLFRALVGEFLIGCLIVASMTGCASMPPTGQASNGQSLRIVEKRIDDSGVRTVETGANDHYNSSGNYTGTTVQYQKQFVVDSHMEYELRQGSAPIDAQDFMRIAGDIQGANQLEADRKQGVWMNRAGFPLTGLGVALALIAAQSMGNGGGKGSHYLYSGGAALMGGGYLMIHFGGIKARPLKVLNGKKRDDMRILDRLDGILRNPPAPAAPASGSLSPATPPKLSAAPSSSAPSSSPAAEVVAR